MKRSHRGNSGTDSIFPREADPETVHPCLFFTCVFLSVLPSVLCLVWVVHYAGGLAWDGSHQQFNWHPLCMLIALVTFLSNGLMSFRIFPFRRRARKFVHATLNLASVFVAIVGLVAVFQNHQKSNIPHLYSLHSWCGLAAIVLYFMQWTSGLIVFVLPLVGIETRSSYMPYHIRAGFLIFALIIATCLVGLNEKMNFLGSDHHAATPPTGGTLPPLPAAHHHSVSVQYSDLPAQAILVNLVGFSLLALAALVFVVISQYDYTRSGRNGGFMLLPMK